MSETQERDERVTFKMRIIWTTESERQFHIYTLESWFFRIWGEGLTNEQDNLGSLRAGPFVSPKLRLISFQSFFKKITGFEDSKASLTTPWTKEQYLNFWTERLLRRLNKRIEFNKIHHYFIV